MANDDKPPRARANRQGLWLVLPLVAFVAVFFAAPIGAMLWRSVSNPLPASLMPRTAARLPMSALFSTPNPSA